MVFSLQELAEVRKAIAECESIIQNEGYTLRSYRYKGTPLHAQLRWYLILNKWFPEWFDADYKRKKIEEESLMPFENREGAFK